ncbi:potassium channel family protein [Kitasatospora sp. NPDC056138]|uniref:potassium channel family protein n=1 Tax=Kitasatospora sp. NPDC056138 TaxID=3345724 RepID=UPI0035DC0BFD
MPSPSPEQHPQPYQPQEPLRRHELASLGLTLLGPVVLVVLYFTLPLDVFGPKHPAFGWFCFTLLLVVVAMLLLREIWQAMMGLRGRPGLMILLLSALALVVFATAYLALSRQPGQFIGLRTRLDALYFTVITMSTVGYGDITPHGQEARVVVMLQILYTLIFLTAGATTAGRQLRVRLAERAVPPRAERHHRRRAGD